MGTHWLMKSEPEPRVVQGVDVSFSADTFEKAKVTSWEGVRNYQARQFLRDELKVGHEVLFYHSNTKLPGIAALAEVCRDGYPDPTAWDSKHPYYDAKATDKANPRWFRVDVRFVRRLPYFVPLALLQHIAQGLSAEQRKDVAYLSDEHLAGIAGMALLNRSRLSVQTSAYEAVCLLGDHGNFSTWPGKWNEDGAKRRRAEANTPTKRAKMNQDTRAPNAAPPPSDAAPRTRRARRSPHFAHALDSSVARTLGDADAMPLEHFGATRQLSDSHRAPRPLSEPVPPDSWGKGVSRAASDAQALTQARDRLRSGRKAERDDEDDAILSKLTGVSRSVSWGRSTASGRTAPQTPSELRTPGGRRTASTRIPSGSRLRSHHVSASLSMSPSVAPNDIPEDQDVFSSQKSSPASSAALSLRSLSSLSRSNSVREQDSFPDSELRNWRDRPSGSLSDSPKGLGLQQPIILSPTEAPVLSPLDNAPPLQVSDEKRASSERAAPLLSIERLDQALPPLPTIDVEQMSPRSPVPALDLAVPVSPRSAAPPLSESSTQQPPLFSTPGTAESSFAAQTRRSFQEGNAGGLPHDMSQFNIARKHAGSFQTRASGVDLSQSMHSLQPDEAPSEGGSTGTDLRPRSKLTRFFSRIFNEQRSQSAGSDSDSLQSFSPQATGTATSPISALHPVPHRDGWRSPLSESSIQRQPYASTPSLMQLTSTQVLPRPPRSPMMAPIPTQDDDLSEEEDLQAIHGLTTRSATPARSLSPVTTRANSFANLAVPPMAAPQPLLAPALQDLVRATDRSRTIDDYDIGEDMGSGAYGFVRRARPLFAAPDDEQDVVIKYIVKSCILADSWRRHRTYGTIPAEIFVLLQLQHTPYTPQAKPPPWIKDKAHWIHVRQQFLAKQQRGEPAGHPGICHLLDFFEDEEYYYLVMRRFGDGQDLFDFVESCTYGLNPSDVRSFLGQVCDVVAYMHANNIVHRDIKDENVILDRYGMTQLIDFGSAARIRANRKFDTFSGTMDYAAAEIIQGEKYSGPPQDVWAFGVTAYVLVCGECPFRDAQEAMAGLKPDSRPMQVLRHFCFEQRFLPPRPRASSVDSHSSADEPDEEPDGGGGLKQVYDLICQCLQLDPDQRPTAADLLQHRFLAGARGWLGVEGWRAETPSDRPGRSTAVKMGPMHS